jgi:ATP-binding cassette, subfamily B, bacterial MsbA
VREELSLFRYLKQASGLVIILFLCIVVYSATMFSIAWVFKVGYDEYLPTGSGAALLKMLALIIGISTTRIISYYLVNRIAHVIRFRVRRALRFDLLKHLLETQYSFFQQSSVGSLVNRLIPETDMAAEVLVKACEAAVYLFQIIAFFAYLMILDASLGFFYLLLFCAALALMLLMRRRIEQRQLALSKTRDGMYGFFNSYFTSMKEIKCYNMFPLQKDILRKIMDEDGRHNASLTRSKSVLDLSATVPALIGMGFLFVWGFNQLVAGVYSYGSLLMMLFLLSVLYLPMIDFSAALATIQLGRAALNKVYRLFGSDLEPQTGSVLPPVQKMIKLNRLSFSYIPERSVFDGINIDFTSNTFTAIVGESGSGKTTLVNLLLRLYAVPDGRIIIDDNDINAIAVNSLREHIGIVSQDFIMLDATLKENIDVQARLSDAEVLDVCQDVGLSDLVGRLPAGIHTLVVDEGKSLSGGERQRIAVARCLAKKVQVMIMDEATSALDFNTERRIIGTLLDLRNKRRPFMIISITHRPSFARYADRIFVLEKGVVAESGTHKELLAKKRAYFSLFSNIES